MIDPNQSLDIAALLDGYRTGRFTPRDVIELALERSATHFEYNIWIERLSRERLLAYADALDAHTADELPLYGIPFAIKDNIDLAGVATTAACEAFRYSPTQSAYVVQRLIEAGAIPIGKTNLDQFATGLVGTRSPYGVCHNAFDPDYISGGSSAGSAVAVALGQVSFSLGTDTAGSGRVPAAFNNLIGLKPTRGLLSTSGVVPACRSLDCVSIFSLCADDARRVLDVAAHFDSADAFARPPSPGEMPSLPTTGLRVGVPRMDQLEFFGDTAAQKLFAESSERLRALDATAVEIDLAPFLAAARLLYEGPWVAERYLATRDLIESQPGAMLPVTREIISGGTKPSALDAFNAQYRLAELKRASEAVWSQVDVILTPTAGTIYRIDEVNADPIRLNSNLGYYTNFMNLLDLSAAAAPAGFRADGLPFGVTLFAPALNDRALLALADRLHRVQGLKMGATAHPLPEAAPTLDTSPDEFIQLAVCGAHMSGLPLNEQLSSRDARLLERTHTAARYRLYALPGGPPRRPGLIRGDKGGAIEVEVWTVPAIHVGSFVAGIPAPLGIGKLELADGRWVTGFICEGHAVADAEDISRFGGWRGYLKSLE